MVDLEKVKKCYTEKEKLDKELVEQLKLIKEILGSQFTYKDFEYNIPNDMIDIDDVQDCGDGILDIFYITGEMDVTFICIDEELLTMSETELRVLKEIR